MRITTLIENSPHPKQSALKAEHGLSFFIEHRGHILLSDVGATTAFAENASLLGLELKKVEAVTISHHHYDHGGGLQRFFEENGQGTVFLRWAETEDYIAQSESGSQRYIGLDQAVLAANRMRIKTLDANQEILPGVHILTEIPALYPKPGGDQRLRMVRNGQTLPDTFVHEIVTVLEGESGLVVMSGCAHNGVLNMVAAVRQAFLGKPITALIGGFHLLYESAMEVRKVGEALAEMDIPVIYTGHCTGDASAMILADVLGDKYFRLFTGLVLEF